MSQRCDHCGTESTDLILAFDQIRRICRKAEACIARRVAR